MADKTVIVVQKDTDSVVVTNSDTTAQVITSTVPNTTTRLNYGGYFYPTYINLSGSSDTATAATHYFVETGSDGYVRPKTLANTKAELVTTASVSSAFGMWAIFTCTGTSVANSLAAVPLAWQTEEYDVHGWHVANATNVIPTTAGAYQVSGWVNFTNDTTGSSRGVAIQLNGVTQWYHMDDPKTANYTNANVSGLVVVNGTTDYITLIAQHNSTPATLTVTGRLSLHFVGA